VSLTRRNVLRGVAVGAALAAGSALADPLRLPVQAFCTGNGLRKVVLRKAQPGVVQMLHPERLARYVDPLPIPAILRGGETRPDPEHPGRVLLYHRIAMREAWANVHRDLPPTRFWGYDGKMPGPTIEVQSGKPLLIEWANELPKQHLFPIDYTLHGAGHDVPDVRAVVHVHGARVPPEADGYPESWYVGGKSATYRYPNRQEATTLWYHDHAMGIERLNVYAGLFGSFLVRDEIEASLHLPQGEFEIPLMISDRLFTADGQLYYPNSGVPESPWVSEVYGDVILMNGKISPYLEVEPRPYRFRLVNASNARFYYIALSDDSPLQQIGSDQGLLPHPVSKQNIVMGPAERADVVIDFGKLAGKTVLLKSQALELMQIRVAPRTKTAVTLPTRGVPAALRPVKRIARSAAVKTRTLTLNTYIDPKTHMMMMLLNGTYWHQPITEKPVLGSTEIWEFVNPTDDMHPIHLHLVRFQVLNRQAFDVDEYMASGKVRFSGLELPPNDNEHGWKDTVQCDSGLITRIIVPFEGYPGRYVWHCHVLEHAANEMMRPYEVVRG
jgi:spore coat protein A, manganese oxidase